MRESILYCSFFLHDSEKILVVLWIQEREFVVSWNVASVFLGPQLFELS